MSINITHTPDDLSCYLYVISLPRITAILISVTIPLKLYLTHFSLFCILFTWNKCMSSITIFKFFFLLSSFKYRALRPSTKGLPKALHQSVNQYSNVFFSQIQIHQRDDLQFSFRSTMGEWKDFIFQITKDMIYGTYGISLFCQTSDRTMWDRVSLI